MADACCAVRSARGPSARRRARWATALLVGLTCFAAEAGAQDAAQLERAIKATFLYKFGLYVSWPDQAFAAPSSPFTICVVGGRPFAALLDRAVAGQSVGQRPVAVVRLDALASLDPCHVAYLAPGDPDALRRALAASRGRPVLTVTDAGRPPSDRGIVNFVVVDDKVRFEIDDAEAERSGLSVSSKLLSLAVHVSPP